MVARVLVALLIVGKAAGAVAQESLPVQTVTAVKDATVMIMANDPANPDAGVSGSGFLFRVDGPTGYVATNRHVISPPPGLFSGRPIIKVILRSGTRGERSAAAEVVAATTEPDLAILKVQGVPDWPAPIDVLKETELVETMPVFVFGFPFGSGLAAGHGRPSVVVGKGSVSSVRRDDDGRVQAVLIDGALNPGNSGGPVVDARGRLVGVAVAAIRGAHIGIAIAPGDLVSMLAGRPQGLTITAGSVGANGVELAVEVPLFDPLDNVKSLAFSYVVGGPGAAEPRRVDRGGSWEPLAGATSVPLKVEAHRGRGALTLPAGASTELDLTYQIAVADARGRVIRSRPGRYLLAIARQPAATPEGGSLAFRGNVIDPDGDCTVHVDKNGLSLEIPGSFHDLNAQNGKENAPRILRRVDDDFVAQVRVCGEFQPEGPPTREGALPFHGAGILLWLDAEHYLRLERGAALRNNQRIGAFLLLERYEMGRPVARNNAYLEEGDVSLRIERHGRKIVASFSTDGREWAEAHAYDLDWPGQLSIGLDAVNSAFSPFKVRFEEFSVRKTGARGAAAP